MSNNGRRRRQWRSMLLQIYYFASVGYVYRRRIRHQFSGVFAIRFISYSVIARLVHAYGDTLTVVLSEANKTNEMKHNRTNNILITNTYTRKTIKGCNDV